MYVYMFVANEVDLAIRKSARRFYGSPDQIPIFSDFGVVQHVHDVRAVDRNWLFPTIRQHKLIS